MDWSSIDFLSRLVKGSSCILNLRKIDESKSSGISILSFDDSSPDNFSTSFKKTLQIALIVLEWKISHNYVSGLLSFIFILNSLNEVCWLISLFLLVSWNFNFDISSHHVLIVHFDSFLNCLISLKLDKSSSFRRTVWVSQEFYIKDFSAFFEEFLEVVFGGFEVQTSNEDLWVAVLLALLVTLLGLLLLFLYLRFWLRFLRLL